MKTHIALPLAFLITFLLAAVSTGSPILLLPAVFLALVLLAGLASVVLAARSLRVSADLDASSVPRGQEVRMHLQVRHRGLLPIAPVMLEISPGAGLPVREICLRDAPGKLQTL